ncbi:uncharacterized protein [Bemisia tabaci]|uniref:uncharacterized protein isoform X3 n=1 Tax=Bemisia tabaci TaxID=7038 RepID=UPI003B28D1FC
MNSGSAHEDCDERDDPNFTLPPLSPEESLQQYQLRMLIINVNFFFFHYSGSPQVFNFSSPLLDPSVNVQPEPLLSGSSGNGAVPKLLVNYSFTSSDMSPTFSPTRSRISVGVGGGVAGIGGVAAG